MKHTKRLLALVLSLVFCLGLLAVGVSADPGDAAEVTDTAGTTGYVSLQDAFEAAETGATVKLLADQTVAAGEVLVLNAGASAINLDLNGHTFTVEGRLVGLNSDSRINVDSGSNPGIFNVNGNISVNLYAWSGDTYNIIGGIFTKSFGVDGGQINISGGEVDFGETSMVNNGGPAAIDLTISGNAKIKNLTYIVYVDEATGGLQAGVADCMLTLEGGYYDVNPATYKTGQMGGPSYDQSAFVSYNESSVEQYTGQSDWEADPAVYPWRIKSEPAVTTYPLWVGGTQVTEANASDIFGDGKASYDAGNNKLSLNGYTYTGPGCEDFNACAAIRYQDIENYADLPTLTIDLTGKNKITHTTDGTTSYGIYSDGDLIFQGTGSLTVTSATMTAESGYSYGIDADLSTMTVNGCSLTVTAGLAYESYGMMVTGDDPSIAIINDGALTVSGCGAAVLGTVSIAGTGWTNTAGSEGKADIAAYDSGSQSMDGYLKVQFPAVAEEYSVTFDKNGHSDFSHDPLTVLSGGMITAPTAPTAEGWTFGGWFKEAACTNEWVFDTDTVTANTTLYAKWTEVQTGGQSGGGTGGESGVTNYTVRFDTDGGAPVPEDQSVAKGGHAAQPATNPTKADNTFRGWYQSDKTTRFDFRTYVINADTTVYALWTEVQAQPVIPDEYYYEEETPVTEPVSEPEPEVVEEGTVTVAAEVEDGAVTAAVSDDAITEALESKTEESDTLTLTVESEGAESVTLSLSAEAVQSASEAEVAVHVETEKGTVKLAADTLGELAEAGAEIAVSVTANEDGTTTFDLTADGETVDARIKVELPAEDAGQVLVIVNADGTEQVVKKSVVSDGTAYLEIPAGATVKAVDAEPMTFDDVPEDAEYAGAVDFVSSRGIFQGTGEGFAPEAAMNRAMLVTVLFRLEDASAAGESPFPDVTEGAWYADAAAWASETGLVNGTDKGFEPNEPITLEQIATVLYRYAGSLGLDTGTGGAELPESGIADWAQDAMSWAISMGLIDAESAGDPQGEVNRGTVAVLLERMIGLIVK